MMKSPKKVEKQFIKEYNEIMKSNSFTISIHKQWNNKSDQIEKFTMYENYTPVKTSSGTGKII